MTRPRPEGAQPEDRPSSQQNPSERCDVTKEDSQTGEITPLDSSANSHQSPNLIRRDGVQPSRPDNGSSSADAPVVSLQLNEHPDSQNKQTRIENSNPALTNQTSSLVTQQKDVTAEEARRKERNRRARIRKRKRKQFYSQDPIAENSHSDLTGATLQGSGLADGSIYYAIRNGKYGYNGVHTDWDVCARYLKDACGATFKSFSTLEEAFMFAHGDPSPRQAAPQKELNRDVHHQSQDGRTDTPPVRAIENEPLEEIEPAEHVRPLNHRYCLQGQTARNDQQPEAMPRFQSDGLREDGRPLGYVAPPEGDPSSLEEIRPVKETEPPKDVRLQKWKVEPVLLPTSLFSSADTTVKREATVVPVERGKVQL